MSHTQIHIHTIGLSFTGKFGQNIMQEQTIMILHKYDIAQV